ncbi:MAG: hypothetical protein P8X74_06720 [Reinekea sp.]
MKLEMQSSVGLMFGVQPVTSSVKRYWCSVSNGTHIKMTHLNSGEILTVEIEEADEYDMWAHPV